MKKFSLDEPVKVTKKIVLICFSFMVVMFILSITAFVKSISNGSNIQSNYQILAKNVNQIEEKIGDGNTLFENLSVLDDRTSKINTSLSEIVVDIKTLKDRADINASDVLDVKNFIKNNDLEEFINKIGIRQNNIETEIDSLKSIQKAQQSRVDEFKNSVIEYKNQVVDKVTNMLSSNKSPSSPKKNNVSASSFKYQLSSIEYRSGEEWAVFAPKNKITALSELKFLAVGDILDQWQVIKITNNSVRLNNNGQQLVLSVQ